MNTSLGACLILLCSATLCAAQGFAGLGQSADAFGEVVPDRALVFPADHGPHEDFRIEWWYLTAVLEDDEGHPMGLQWTLFRQANRPGGPRDGWQSAQTWMGHAAITTRDRHLVAETFARGGIGQAGAIASPFRAWIDDWHLTAPTDPAPSATADALDQLTVAAAGDGFSYDLSLTAEGPLTPQGRGGYSVKSQDGQASYYYSQPFYRAQGTVRIGEREITVTGRAWLDREWSSQPLASDQTGWDWFALHLPGGGKMMAFRLRSDRGDYLQGSWIDPDGTVTPLYTDEVRLTPLSNADVAGREIPVEWRIEVPGRGVDVTTQALNPQAFMTTAFPYWEGPIAFDGTHKGRGYLEMTGYE